MSNFLNAEDSPFDALPSIARYYRVVAAKLLPEQSTHTVAFAVCLPSFEREWTLRLHGTDRRGFTVTTSEPETPLWGAEDESVEVAVSQQSVDVSPKFADALTNALAKALLTVANVNRPPSGLDGVSYHFVLRHSQHGRLSGQTWSPRSTTIAGRIVDLIERLRECVNSKDSLTSSIDVLTQEFQDFDAGPQYECNNRVLTFLAKQTRQFVNLERNGVISANELTVQLDSVWQDSGLPAIRDVLRLVDDIPPDVRDAMQYEEKAGKEKGRKR